MTKKEATIEMRFEYDSRNFDEFDDEMIKRMVQDTMLDHPEIVYESIEVDEVD